MESDRSGPMLETVMLGLRWRGYLSDHDRNLVDWLFGEPQVAFLLRDGEYLHPEGVPLLPEGALDVPPLQNREAIFSLRLTASHRNGEGRGLLRAARLSRMDEPELIIGCLGCEDSPGRRVADDRFGRLVARFRDAWERAGRIETALRRRIDQTEPYLIVCRTSGRIIAASEAMAIRLGSPAEFLAGQEYSEIAARMAAGLNGDSLNLENVRLEETFLCVASLRNHPKPAAPRPEPLLSDFFVHKMKNKLSSIVAASSQLGDMLPPQDDFAELLDVIASESSRLDSYLDRLNLLAAGKNSPRMDTGIMDSLRAAVNNLTVGLTPAPAIEFRGVRTTRSVRIVPQGLPLLFDAILRAHRVTHRDHSITAIRIGETDGRTEVSVFTEWSQESAAMAPDANWHEYATHLAESLGLTYYRRSQTDTSSVSSIVEMNHLEEAARDDR